MSSNELVEQIMAQVIARVATPEQQAILKIILQHEKRLWQRRAAV